MKTPMTKVYEILKYKPLETNINIKIAHRQIPLFRTRQFFFGRSIRYLCIIMACKLDLVA